MAPQVCVVVCRVEVVTHQGRAARNPALPNRRRRR